MPQFFSARLQDVIWVVDPLADILAPPTDVVYVLRSGARGGLSLLDRVLPAVRSGHLGLLL